MPLANDLDYIWGLLEEAGSSNHGLRIREADEFEILGHKLLFAVDEYQHRQLLIPVAADKKLKSDTRSSGVQIVSRKLIDRDVPRVFLVVNCLKPHLNQLFNIISAEIIERLQANGNSPDLTAVQVINRWRELLESVPSNLPSREVLTGIFGELYILKQLANYEPDVLKFWLGPNGARHDFLAKTAALEVKTTVNRNRTEIMISGCDQLAAPTNAQLYLAVICLEPVGSGGDSLLSLVECIVSFGVERSMLLRQLAKLDITSETLGKVRNERYVVSQENVYLVDEAFPKIVASSFVGGKVPNLVRFLNYQLDLSGNPPHPLPKEDVQNIYTQIAKEAAQ